MTSMIQPEKVMVKLRKGSFSLSLTYSDGNFSNNLVGDNAYYETWVNTCELSFDLKRNFRSRNKDGNDYLDINELNEQRDKLQTVQIFDSSIASTIKKIIRLCFSRVLKLA